MKHDEQQAPSTPARQASVVSKTPRQAEPQRVCMVVNNLDVGGLEKVVISLLQNLDRGRVQPSLICLNGPGKLFDEVQLPAQDTLVLNKRQRKLGPVSVDVDSLMAIRRFLKRREIQLVHAHNAAPLIYAGLARHSLRPRPAMLYSEHNQIYSASDSARKKFKLYVRLADQIVAVSHDLERTLQQVGVPRPVQVIHNGIDGARFSLVDGGRVRAELGAGPDDFLVGTGVVLSKQKGIEYLIQAARSVLAQTADIPSLAGRKIRFVVAGDGPLRQALEASAQDLGDRFSFLGYRGDMPDFISALDLYVLPSLWEGLPLALCEALAMGKPVLCTSVGGNPEVILDGENGFVVPPKDPPALAAAILKAAAEPDRLARLQAKNRERFEHGFSVRAMVDAHHRLFDRMLGA